MNLYRALL